MSVTVLKRDDLIWVSALAVPLLVRLYGEGTEAAVQRMLLLALALGVAYAWAIVFSRVQGRPLGGGIPALAMAFVLMLPGPVSFGGAVLALSFGAVFGREIFGGRVVLPPALVGLAFAVFSFPQGGFEARSVLALSPDFVFAVACLGGVAILAWRGAFAWQIAAGAIVGVASAGLLMGGNPWWEHLGTGSFAAGIVFLAAAPESAVAGRGARWLHGILVGSMVVVFRLADPAQPDGVVFAALLGALFAPLIDQALALRPRRA